MDPIVNPEAGTGTPPATTPPSGATPPEGTPAPGANPGDEGKTVPLAALQEERTKRQELASQLEVLQQQVSQMGAGQPQQQVDAYGNPIVFQQAPQYPQQAPALQQMPGQEQLAQLWEQDPMQAVNYQISMAMNQGVQANQYVEGLMMQSRSSHQDFQRYEGSIRNQLNALAPQQKLNPHIVEATYFMMKGRDADNLVNAAAQGVAGRQVAGANAAGINAPGGVGAPPAANAPLNDDELKVASLMGMTPEEYIVNRRK